uniref:Ubiquitin-protein ligase E3B n=1 Tax=Trichuris muris TaxID=70415 RepID=A0A5S6QH07_TRIMR
MPHVLYCRDVAPSDCFVSKLDLATEDSLNLYLRLLLTYTSSDQWVFLSTAKGDKFRKPLEKLCSYLLSFLVSEGFYPKIAALLKRGLCRGNILFKPASLSTLLSLTLRPLDNAEFVDDMLHAFIVHILSTPALTWHVKHVEKDFEVTLNARLLSRSIEYLCAPSHRSAALADLAPGFEICVLANLIHLIYMETSMCKSTRRECVECLGQIVTHCGKDVVYRQTSVTYWHPFLGWYSSKLGDNLQDALPHVLKQMQLLWHHLMVSYFFHDLLKKPSSTNEKTSAGREDSLRSLERRNKLLGFLYKWRLTPTQTYSTRVEDRNQVLVLTDLIPVLTFYEKLLTTFTPLKYDILAGLCYQDVLLPKLWAYFVSSDVQSSVTYHLTLLKDDTAEADSVLKSISVFFESASYLLTIADDYELFTLEKPFNVSELTEMARFSNLFIFRSIWENWIDVQAVCSNNVFTVIYGFLMLIYSRDCRRSFTPEGFWLMKDLKPAAFFAEVGKGNARAQFIIQRIPHVVPREERIKLFRKYVAAERVSSTFIRQLDEQPTVITVHRSRIVEDGFRQLSLLSGQILKGIVRVKFINEQGLDEPGIDQDGVFKEFLEEIITRVFDPSLNLFKLTSEGHMYPSPTSLLHDNYLPLFQFVGKMIGKAVFEGIAVDVFLARFVLNHIIGRSPSKYYSCIDELASLDADLYRHLSFIKHFEGDVSELGLTFSCDEDVMGEIVTHDLRPGGRTIPVTNESRISYVHLMAYHRMHVQIKHQLEAFVRGFHELISPDWLQLFSADEFQLMLSGDVSDIDLNDLRKHTQYFGGFHKNHRVIKWLWEILENDFTAQERRLFLKFVTSCSKPPLLGFEYLEPPFSIRCVEVGDDQDEGDTLGSVIRGFLAIRKKDPVGRLPTSSTCFNLLKLPNYQKKATLRDKLRYAVNCGTGFELS